MEAKVSLPVYQVVAIVMDMLSDLQILQDLLDASSRRGVAVYAVLEARGVPHFLDMCTRLQISAVHLRVSGEPSRNQRSGSDSENFTSERSTTLAFCALVLLARPGNFSLCVSLSFSFF